VLKQGVERAGAFNLGVDFGHPRASAFLDGTMAHFGRDEKEGG
jgi:hypothetical protein